MSGLERSVATAGRQERPRCAARAGIEVLQEKWVLHIVHALLDGPMGFNAIGREVGGCNPTTLTQRLARLESLGLIAKKDGNEAGSGAGNGRSCYSLTASGRSLQGVIDAIRAWAEGNLSAQEAR